MVLRSMATGMAATPPGTGVLKDERAGSPHRPRDHPRATHHRHPEVGPARLRPSELPGMGTVIPATGTLPPGHGAERLSPDS